MTFKHFVVTGLFGVLAAILLLILFNLSGSPFPGRTLAVDAEDLLQAYKLDRRAADRKFTNRELEITGKVYSKDPLILTKDPGVVCEFAEAKRAQLARIQVGDTITVRGRCQGLDAEHSLELDLIFIHNCELVQARP